MKESGLSQGVPSFCFCDEPFLPNNRTSVVASKSIQLGRFGRSLQHLLFFVAVPILRRGLGCIC
jgi:hypothetical protein